MKSALNLFFWIDLIGINIAVGYLVFQNINKPVIKSAGAPVVSVEPVTNSVSYVDQCGEECKKYIDSKLVGVKVTPMPTTQAKPIVATTAVPNKVRRISYVSIPGSAGGTNQTDWVDLGSTEFYFDTKDYPGLVEIYFESNMNLINGSGRAYVRLFDSTHGIGVQGSEISTQNNSSELVTSGRLSFWAGRNVIRVQVKSLTAETAQFNSGRLRIVTEN